MPARHGLFKRLFGRDKKQPAMPPAQALEALPEKPKQQKPKQQFYRKKVFYSRNAVGVPEGKHYHALQNVEWIKKSGIVLGKGGYGIVFLGRVKFKGKPSKQCVLKEIHALPLEFSKAHYPRIIGLLEKSAAKHPKMAFAEIEGKAYLVMEPFLRVEGSARVSKFGRNNLRFRWEYFNLLKKAGDIELFEKAVVQAALIAKVGLAFNVAQKSSKFGGTGRTELIDVFAAIEVRNGKQQVFVQDIDELAVKSSPAEAWQKMASGFLEVLNPGLVSGVATNRNAALKIINKIAEQHGLPQINGRKTG